MINVKFKNFAILNFQCNSTQSKQKINLQSQSCSNSLCFKGNLENLEELASKKEDILPDLKKYYKNAQTIAKHIQGKLPYTVDATTEGINQYRDRIPLNGSMGLRVDHGLPDCLLTPLGRMPITRGGLIPDKKVIDNLIEELGLIQIKQEGRIQIYAITKDLDGKEIPKLNVEDITPFMNCNISGSVNKLLYESCPEREC